MFFNIPNAVLTATSVMAGITTLTIHIPIKQLNTLKTAFAYTFFSIGLLTLCEHWFNPVLAGSSLSYGVTIICFAIAVSILLGLTFIHTLQPQKQLAKKITIAIVFLVLIRMVYSILSPYIEPEKWFAPAQSVPSLPHWAKGVYPLLIVGYLTVLAYFNLNFRRAVAAYRSRNGCDDNGCRIETRMLSRTFYIALALGLLSLIAAFEPTGCRVNNLFCWLFAATIGALSLTFVQHHRWMVSESQNNHPTPPQMVQPEIPIEKTKVVYKPIYKPGGLLPLFNTQIIESNLIFQHKFTQTVCAERLCVSHSQLQKKIKEECGLTFSELCRKYRIEKAMALYEQNSAYTAKEIAVTVGYQSPRVLLNNLEKYKQTMDNNEQIAQMVQAFSAFLAKD